MKQKQTKIAFVSLREIFTWYYSLTTTEGFFYPNLILFDIGVLKNNNKKW